MNLFDVMACQERYEQLLAEGRQQSRVRHVKNRQTKAKGAMHLHTDEFRTRGR